MAHVTWCDNGYRALTPSTMSYTWHNHIKLVVSTNTMETL